MTAPLIILGDAVVAELNTPVSVTWTQEFTAARAYRIRRELKDITGWLVTVAFVEEEIELENRTLNRHDTQLDIGIQTKVNPDANADCDAVLDLQDEFVTYWLRRRPAGASTQTCFSAKKLDLYLPEHLDSRVCTSITRLTFRMAA